MSINYNYNYANVARQSGFKLRQFKDGPIDWRLLGSIDIERVVREQSFEQIDGILNHLSEVPLGAMLDTNILDNGICKYFIVSQFAVQYLLFCRKFMDETARDLREALVGSEGEVAKLRKSLGESNNQIVHLNKKITQMEALHKVLFPCHLCTKNFVDNESLNLHIARKHAGRISNERHVETPTSGQKDKENDINLIKTIKLELEIKQLKERLNIAEREIEEHSTKNRKLELIREEANNKESPKSAAIQCNLSEEKEFDDSCNRNYEGHNGQGMSFESWQQVQKEENAKLVANINEKLSVIISDALQNFHNKPSKDIAQGKAVEEEVSSELLEFMERTVVAKVEEICKGSADQLNASISNMELNYKKQFSALQEEIRLKYEMEARKNSMPVMADVLIKTPNSKVVRLKDIESQPPAAYTRAKRQILTEPLAETRTNKLNAKNSKSLQKLNKDIIEEDLSLSTSTSKASNMTFVKSIENQLPSKDLPKCTIPQTSKYEDNTEMSDSLSDDDTSSAKHDESSSISDTDQSTASSVNKKMAAAKKSQKKTVGFERNEDVGKLSPEAQPKEITRKDVKRLSSERLGSVGLDMKTKSVSNGVFKKASKELLDQRTKQVQKYPQFHNTRMRLRKFVDRLCTSKLPKNAEKVLKSTEPIPPSEPGPSSSLLEKNALHNPNFSFNPREKNASSPLSNKE